MLNGLPPLCELIDQVMSVPAPAGKGSLKLTPVAVPWPSLLMVTVKCTAAPALTVGVSVVLVMSTSGALMVIVAVADWFCSAVLSLAAVTVAVLLTVPVKVLGLTSLA